MAESGKEASFLAGGEFPIPVVQGSQRRHRRSSIQFKEFGVRLNFTPTVNGDRVHLKVRPEVSTLDYANGVSLQGFRIPGAVHPPHRDRARAAQRPDVRHRRPDEQPDDVDAAEDSRHRRHPDPRPPVQEQGGAEGADRAGRDDHAGDPAERLRRRDDATCRACPSRTCRRCPRPKTGAEPPPAFTPDRRSSISAPVPARPPTAERKAAGARRASRSASGWPTRPERRRSRAPGCREKRARPRPPRRTAPAGARAKARRRRRSARASRQRRRKPPGARPSRQEAGRASARRRKPREQQKAQQEQEGGRATAAQLPQKTPWRWPKRGRGQRARGRGRCQRRRQLADSPLQSRTSPMARLSGSILSDDEAFKAQLADAAALVAVPVIVGDRAAPAAAPTWSSWTAATTSPSAVALVERLRVGRRRPPASSSSPSDVQPDAILQVDAGRRQRVLRLAAGARRRWTRPSQRTAARRAVVGAAAGDDAGVLRRQGRRRHDDDGGELRRRSRAPQQEAHGDRGPQARASARCRCSSACAAATRCSTRSTTCTASTATSCASWWSSTSRASRCWPARISSIGPAPGDSPGARGSVPAAGAAVRVHRHRRRLADEPVRGVGALHGRHDRPGGQPRRAVRAQRAAAARAHRASSARAASACKILLNRAAEPYPIPPAQLQSALGQPIFHTFPSDYKAVSSALNSGVPLALSGNTEMATQFDAFTRAHHRPGGRGRRTSGRRPARRLGVQRLASIW